jgi:hypothetical protein
MEQKNMNRTTIDPAIEGRGNQAELRSLLRRRFIATDKASTTMRHASPRVALGVINFANPAPSRIDKHMACHI